MGLISCRFCRSSGSFHQLLNDHSSEDIDELPNRPTLLFYPDPRDNSMTALHDAESPSPGCCKKSRIFRVYCETDANGDLYPSGLHCENCHVEYLDRENYQGAVYDEESQINVNFYKVDDTAITDNGPPAAEPWSYCHEPKTITMYKKIASLRYEAPNAFLSMVSPSRKFLDHLNVKDIETLQAGDHIMWHRPYALWHHQLIKENKGNGKCDVIHFDSGQTRRVKAEVQFIRDFDFTRQTNSGTAYKIIYDESVERENPLKLVFDRANSKLKDTNFAAFKNNCEHLVTFCKTGTLRSLQVYWLLLKFVFLLLRITVLSIFIYISIKFYLSDQKVSHHEEIGELIIVLSTEFVLCSAIIGWHIKLYRDNKIGALDCGRRIGEAQLESVITVVFYLVHVFLMFKVGKKIPNPSLHIFLAIVLGFAGRVIGCLASQAVVPKILKPTRMTDNQPRRRPTYGASDVRVFGEPTSHEGEGV